MYANRRNLRVLKEIGVEEHDGDVRFQTGSGNIALSFMRHASGHNYRNSSFIKDVAMGQIPRSTERTSSLHVLCVGLSEWSASEMKHTLWHDVTETSRHRHTHTDTDRHAVSCYVWVCVEVFAWQSRVAPLTKRLPLLLVVSFPALHTSLPAAPLSCQLSVDL